MSSELTTVAVASIIERAEDDLAALDDITFTTWDDLFAQRLWETVGLLTDIAHHTIRMLAAGDSIDQHMLRLARHHSDDDDLNHAQQLHDTWQAAKGVVDD